MYTNSLEILKKESWEVFGQIEIIKGPLLTYKSWAVGLKYTSDEV